MTWARCCTPSVASDMTWRHARGCPVTPWKKLSLSEESDLKDWRETRRADRLPTIDELAAIAQAVHEHPSGKRHLRSVRDEDFVDAHLDDRDDSEVFPA